MLRGKTKCRNTTHNLLGEIIKNTQVGVQAGYIDQGSLERHNINPHGLGRLTEWKVGLHRECPCVEEPENAVTPQCKKLEAVDQESSRMQCKSEIEDLQASWSVTDVVHLKN